MNKEIILFDIDGTLYDPHSMAHSFYVETANVLNKNPEEIISAKEEYKSQLASSADYYPPDLFKFLSKRFGIGEEELRRIFNDDEKYCESLYEETKETLEKLSNNNILGIYSEGFVDFQTSKLEKSGIIDYFDPKYIFIERRKLKDEVIDNLPENSTIIDDRTEVVEKLTALKRFNLFWLNRADRKKENSGITTIHNLKDLVGVLGLIPEMA